MTRGSAADRLIVFTKYPRAGQVKTRLIGLLDPAQAAELQKLMTEEALRTALAAADRSVEVCFEGATLAEMEAWLGPRPDYARQGAGDLGTRMWRALARGFALGAERVALMGSDLPGLPSAYLEQALAALGSHPAVVGPSADGGYYLIGFARGYLTREAFQEIDWSGPKVLEATLHRLHGLGLTPELLPVWRDLDVPGDVEELLALSDENGAAESPPVRYLRSLGF